MAEHPRKASLDRSLKRFLKKYRDAVGIVPGHEGVPARLGPTAGTWNSTRDRAKSYGIPRGEDALMVDWIPDTEFGDGSATSKTTAFPAKFGRLKIYYKRGSLARPRTARVSARARRS